MQLPLTALRAVEAVVRHRSIKKAAEELNVTAAAVSYPLQYLEEYLGVALFRRAPRGLVPNRASSAVQPLLADAFERLHDDSVRDRKSVVEGKSVSVSVDLGGSRCLKQNNPITR